MIQFGGSDNDEAILNPEGNCSFFIWGMGGGEGRKDMLFVFCFKQTNKKEPKAKFKQNLEK